MQDDKLEAVLRQAYAALEQGSLEDARKTATALLEEQPELPESWALMAEIEQAHDQIEAALDTLERGLKRCRQAPLLLGNRAGMLLDTFDDPQGAAEDLRHALKATLDSELRADLLLMLAEAHLRLQQASQALAAAEEAAGLIPDAPEPHNLQAQACYDLYRLDDGLRAVARAVDRDPLFAPAFYSRAEILDAQGQTEEASRALARARALEPEVYIEPVIIEAEDFEAMVVEAIDSLPDSLTAYLQNVAIVVEDRPSVELLTSSDPPLSPGLLGLFEGTPRPAESTLDPWSILPRAVRLFRGNILRGCVDRAEVMDTVATTLFHEIGHFLGLDEDDLIERGLR